jgi:NADP-dependent 3-hydroxy acid dehydrogenase YdfG
MDKPIAWITGATSGIGEATARLLAPTYRLIISGRREDRLLKLQEELGTETQSLSFDIAKRKAVIEAFESLESDWKAIDLLINNAGNAHGLDPIHKGSIDDWDAMIDINVKGLLYLSKLVSEGMVKREKGHIINIGSIAGLEVYPNGNVYCASKHAVDALTKGMRLDLNPYNIKVTSINPGLVETEFSLVRFKGDKERASNVYQNYQPLMARDIAEAIEFVVTRPDHVTIGDMLILPKAQANSTTVKKTAS